MSVSQSISSAYYVDLRHKCGKQKVLLTNTEGPLLPEADVAIFKTDT
jgi:hypothetical protein